MAGHLRIALERALPRNSVQQDAKKAHHVRATRNPDQPLQLGHRLSGPNSERGSEAGASFDTVERAVPSKRPAHLTPTGITHGRTDEHADAGSTEYAGGAHRQHLVSGSPAMTEATAQRLIEALNSHHTSLEETSRTLSEASTQLRDVIHLLKGPRHRL